MRCPKTGFTPLKIISLVVTGVALVVHIAAVAYPVWDGIDAGWRGSKSNVLPIPLPIQASGSLFDFTFVVDATHMFFSPVPARRDTSWKEPIKLLELTAIGVAVVAVALLVLSALIERCTRNYIILLLMRMITISSLLCTALEVILGAMLYKYQHTKTALNKAFDANLNLPVDKYVLKMGWFLECAAGGLFIMASLIAIAESIHNPPPKDGNTSTAVLPFEEKTKVNDKKIKEESPKKSEKLVLEDVNEQIPRKKS